MICNMDIKTIRYSNLMILNGDGTVADVANRIGSSANYFYQVKPSGARGIGGSIARRLEIAYGKERGWMDIPHTDAAEEMKVMDGEGTYTAGQIVTLARNQPVDFNVLKACISDIENALEEPGEAPVSPGEKASMIIGLYVSRTSNHGQARPGDIATTIASIVAGSGR